MILEHADIRIAPGRNAEFEEAINRGLNTVLCKAKGFINAKVMRGIESTERYLLLIEWESVADHNVGFRESPAFAEWRAIIGPFFAAPTVVEHFEATAAKA
ncbi:antibiotic biosynthesis monooxygenase [Xylophilus rhododendri]|uniref:Antibiotic biosynthesis monooxygenase n=1 Tax=Xylophilus rhododendri TaxID=2697032 RepID=A0A857J0W3_9BURK|nr:antibiotic biosynthesis monooxygenase [Xylophilus rhododendri]QHI97237.1 antibiotic biosynthesis monooxygenase [Xylophilus rhododendri]